MLSAKVRTKCLFCGICLLTVLEEGIPGHTMAQGRAGDDGHIQKTRIAQKPAKLCLICQRLMEGGPVGAVSRVR